MVILLLLCYIVNEVSTSMYFWVKIKVELNWTDISGRIGRKLPKHWSLPQLLPQLIMKGLNVIEVIYT